MGLRKHFIISIFALFSAVFIGIGSAHATDPVFSLTTTSLSANDTFQFMISAAGTFYVDCGTDGTLSGTGVSGNTITKSDTTEYTYTCTYSSGDTKTIGFSGSATGYGKDSLDPVILFNITRSIPDSNAAKISSISGSLGQIFGTITNSSDSSISQPNFSGTFYGASNMTGTNIDVPNNPGMKYALPPTLFDGIYGRPSELLFAGTFYGCTGLTGSIPAGLFGNLSGAPAQGMFTSTFYGCSGLTGFGDKTYVPGTFLANINTNTSVSYQASGMFSGTQLAATCPAGTYNSTRAQFNDAGKPWCTACPNGFTSPAGATDVSQCVPDYKFSLTTTSLSTNDTFQFKISAAGTFYVDCGTDGTLSGTGVSGNTITKSNTTEYTYTCTYSSGTAKTIQFGGVATGYRTDDTAAIKFNIDGSTSDTNVKKISSISGSLGQVFGTIENPATGTTGQPKFFRTFYYATNMTGTNIDDPNNSGMKYALPPTLFSGISGTPIRHIFSGTFQGCSGLTGSIPSTLFGNLSGSPAASMFWNTFHGCSGLTGSIPSGLFGNISGSPAQSMFHGTFSGCSGLTGTIPSGLFGNLSGAPADWMFYSTFSGCSGLTGPIPSGLFGSLSGSPATGMFLQTFSGCSNLTGAIPSGLFGSLSGSPAIQMFQATFQNCGGLTGSIPSGLFGNLTGSPAAQMFMYTFNGCSGLTGSIPTGLFGSISGTPESNMFSGTFNNCSGLTGSIPSGLFGNLTGAPAIAMFDQTFFGCGGLSGSIPSGLFGNLTGAPANSMFNQTFTNCSGLTGSIPDGLFGNLTGSPASIMFQSTFAGCRGLTGSIPSGLFGNLTGAPAIAMFQNTFQYCTGLTGFGDKTYVPGDFLGNITTNTSVSGQVSNMFTGTQLAATCPAGTYASTREQFNDAGKPWCSTCPSGTTSNAGATSVSQCVVPHTITYACGLGSGDAPTATSAIPDSSFTPAANTCTPPTGHTFSNWLVSNTGTPGTTVSAGTAFNWTYSEDKTLTAQYTPNSLSLTFDGTTTMSCDYGGTFTVPPAPAPRRGYVFTGWVVNPQPAN